MGATPYPRWCPSCTHHALITDLLSLADSVGLRLPLASDVTIGGLGVLVFSCLGFATMGYVSYLVVWVIVHVGRTTRTERKSRTPGSHRQKEMHTKNDERKGILLYSK